MMKRRLVSLILFPWVLMSMMLSCRQEGYSPEHMQSSSPKITADTELILEDVEKHEENDRSKDDVQKESVAPPLLEEAQNVYIPDFLTGELRELYRQAFCVYLYLRSDSYGMNFMMQEDGTYFSPSSSDAPHYRMDLTRQGETKSEDTRIASYYSFLNPRLRDWDSFQSMGLSLFTEEFWKEATADYVVADGITFYIDVSIGGPSGYFPDLYPDKYELVIDEKDHIVFTRKVVLSFTPNPDLIDENTKLYEREYRFELILTEAGWRFNEFHTTRDLYYGFVEKVINPPEP